MPTPAQLVLDKMERRTALVGFPITQGFASVEEARAYCMAAGKIQCLQCGKKFHKLAPHLKVHDMTQEEYCEYYNIPYTFPLASEDLKDEARERKSPNLKYSGAQKGQILRRMPIVQQGYSDVQKACHAVKEEVACRKCGAIYLRSTRFSTLPPGRCPSCVETERKERAVNIMRRKRMSIRQLKGN